MQMKLEEVINAVWYLLKEIQPKHLPCVEYSSSEEIFMECIH